MKNTFLTRVLATYTIIVFSLLFVIFSGYFAWLQHDTQKKIALSHESNFVGYVGASEELFRSTLYMAATVTSLISLDLFAYSSRDDYYVKLTSLFNDLSTLNQRLAERNVQVVVHKINDRTAVSGTSTTSVSLMLEELGIGAGTYSGILKSLSDTSLYGGHYVFTDDRIVYVTSKNYIDNRMIILVIIEASRFASRQPVQGLKMSYALSENGMTDLRTHAEELPLLFRTVPFEASDRMSRTRIGSLTYISVPSRFLDLRYYYTTTAYLSRTQVVTILLNILALFLVSFSIAFVLILFFSIRLTKPVERLIESFISMGVGDDLPERSRTELEYIAHQVMKIRHSNQELVKTIEVDRRHIKENLLYQLLVGTYNSETIMVELERLSIAWLQEDCHVVLFETTEGEHESFTRDPLYIDKVRKLIEGQLTGKLNFESILYRHDVLCFIIGNDDIGIIKDTMNQIIAVIDTAFSLRLSAVIGCPSEGLAGLHTSFGSALRVLENRNLVTFKSVYDFRDLKELPAEPVVYPVGDEAQLVRAVERHDHEEFERLLDRIFSEYVEKAFDHKEQRELMISALTASIHRALQKVGIPSVSGTEEGYAVYQKLMACRDPDALKEKVLRLFDGIFTEMNHFDSLKISRLKEELEAYIERNLKNNITLIDMSDSFNLSPNYMSYLFKSTLGVNFRDYLSRRRFEIAAGMLARTPSIKLAELAEQVGINNVNTLIRMFHKYGGTSPGQFLKEIGHADRV